MSQKFSSKGGSAPACRSGRSGGKNLVIVESPAKANTLEKFLGSNYKVEASGGHIRDLPPRKLGVDIKHNFRAEYDVIKGKEKIINLLKADTKKAALVFLAPDPDREGEAIAWHLVHLLGQNSKIKRIEFHEITREAVKEAIAHPRKIDMQRVNAQQARRILDRLVGYKISPILWKKVRKGLSAGRVQSVTVRLICKRETEISEFKPQEYWSITAWLNTADKSQLRARLINQNLPDEDSVKKILDDLPGAEYKIAKIVCKNINRNPYPPFITSTLQQEASRRFGFSAKKTMLISQQLYEGLEVRDEGQTGLITYMRTDSTRLSEESKQNARTYIEKKFGKNYLPLQPREYKKKKQAQDAHEAIRPTSVFRTPEGVKISLTPDQYKLYQIIWNRFVASQMASALVEQVSVDVGAKTYTFRANGSTVKFEGFRILYEEMKEEISSEEEDQLPELSEGQVLGLASVTPKQHFTEPPPRYSEASLIKNLEARGIGRPSTYAPIIDTIVNRGYVVKQGKTLSPTDLGILTNNLLLKHFPEIVDIKFTARMEDDLDKIVSGEMDYIKLLKEFYAPFEKTLAKAEVEMKKIKTEKPTDFKCEKCGKPMVIRSGRYGEFLACSAFPKCKTTRNLPEVEAKIPADQKICTKCGKPMVIKSSRWGAFLACSGYPKCKNILPLLHKIGVKCPQCGAEIVEKKTKRKRIFYSCSKYPKCTFSIWEKPVSKTCARCGGLMVEVKKKDEGLIFRCIKDDCGYQEKEDVEKDLH